MKNAMENPNLYASRETEIAEKKEISTETANEQSENYSLLKKIGEEFSSEDSFTISDLNDAFGEQVEGGVEFSEDHLFRYVDEGFLLYDDETKEYSMTEEGKAKADDIEPVYEDFGEAA